MTGMAKKTSVADSDGYGRAFLKGLTRPSLVLFALALAAALCTPALLEYVVSRGCYTDIPLEYLMRHPSDDYTYSSYTLNKVRRNPPKTFPVYLLGGSSMKESFNNTESLSQAISTEAGFPIDSYLFTNPHRSFSTGLTTLTHLPDGPGIVVVGITLSRFSYDFKQLLLDLDGYKVYVKAKALYSHFNDFSPESVSATKSSLPPFLNYIYGRDSILPGILTYFKTYFIRRKKDLFSFKIRPIYYEQHLYTPSRKRFDRAEKLKVLESWKQRARQSLTNFEKNMILLEELLAQSKAKNLEVVLVEYPLDMEIIGDALNKSFDLYKKRLARLAESDENVHYLDFIDELNLTTNDFGDLSHFSFPETRTKMEKMLSVQLKPMLMKYKKQAF